MESLLGKSVIITGASKGIGRELAVHLSNLGLNVSVVARSSSELESLQEEIVSNGKKCLIFSGDVSDSNLANTVASETEKAFGSIDFLINNAGFGIFANAEEIKEEDWSAVMDTNVKGTFLFSKAVIPFMKQKGSGQIITIASDVAKRVFSNGSLYCASKYAQDAFTSALRKEIRPFGIKVSTVYSGLVDTFFHNREQGTEKQNDYLKVQDMAQSISFIMSQGPNVVIDELMIHPLSQEY